MGYLECKMDNPELFNINLKHELNHIYTEEPKDVKGGLDFGWSCREHAFHIYILACLLKRKSGISIGDILIRISNTIITTLDSGSDHAWCIVDNIEPVDFSVTTKYIDPYVDDLSIVWDNNLEELFRCAFFQNEDDEVLIEICKNSEACLVYNKKSEFNENPMSLLENPFNFLHLPSSGLPSLVDIYGSDIFYQITWHCYKLIKKEVKPFFHKKSCSDSTFKAIANSYSDAKQNITKLLQ